jgi:hypothetical protein
MIRKTLILTLCLASGMSFAAKPAALEAPVEIVSAEFGTFDASNPRELVFEPTNVIPHKVGQRYGWIIEVRTSKRALSIREEYVLPAASKPPQTTDPISESLNIPFQRRNQVSQRQLVPVDGKIYGEWAVGPNEPAGHRHLEVVVEGQPGASFEYDVK